MIELLRTNNPVLISWLTTFLADQDIKSVVLDTHTSVLEGSALAIPRRLMVSEADLPRAKKLLDDAREHIPGA